MAETRRVRVNLEELEELERWRMHRSGLRPFYRARWRAVLSCESRTMEIPSYEGPASDDGPALEDLLYSLLSDARSYRDALEWAGTGLPRGGRWPAKPDELAVFGAFVDEMGGFSAPLGSDETAGKRFDELAAAFRGCKREHEELREMLGPDVLEHVLALELEEGDEELARRLAEGLELEAVSDA